MLPPHGGKLVNRRPKTDAGREQLQRRAENLPSIQVSEEIVKDLQNIADGGYSPLTGFMGKNDFLKVVQDKTLEDGTVWTVPIILDVSADRAAEFSPGDEVLLSDSSGEGLAILTVRDVFEYDKIEAAEGLFGTADENHPGVASFLRGEDCLVGGPVKLLNDGFRDFQDYHLRPVETRVLFKEKGWDTVVGFQTRNVPHRGHEYLQKSALEVVDGILVHPKIGKKKVGDWQDHVILAAYRALLDQYYLRDHSAMSIFPANMRYMGPREAVYDAIVRKNYGCTHFIVGRDHAGVGDYYGDFEAHQIFDELSDIDIEPLTFDYAYYCRKCQGMVTDKTCPHSMEDRVAPSGTKIREMIKSGKRPPTEMMRSEVADVILEAREPFVTEGGTDG
ncbi:MAG: sulfate adenylyltransferase [Candidatus Bipolaricaulota bacterium]